MRTAANCHFLTVFLLGQPWLKVLTKPVTMSNDRSVLCLDHLRVDRPRMFGVCFSFAAATASSKSSQDIFQILQVRFTGQLSS